MQKIYPRILLVSEHPNLKKKCQLIIIRDRKVIMNETVVWRQKTENRWGGEPYKHVFNIHCLLIL